MHTFKVVFSARYQVWYAVSAEDQSGSFASIEVAAAKAQELNRLLSGGAA